MTSSATYAYLHLRPAGTPFYVGKGSLRRAMYLGERNAHHQAVVAKYGRSNIGVTLIACASEAVAFAVEVALIAAYRRAGVRLCNFTAGGEGGSDPCHETRERISAAARKRGISQATRDAVSAAKKGVPLTEDHKAKVRDGMRASWSRRELTAEQRANISAAAKRRGIPASTREAQRLAMLDSTRTLSPDHKARIGAAVRRAAALKAEARVG